MSVFVRKARGEGLGQCLTLSEVHSEFIPELGGVCYVVSRTDMIPFCPIEHTKFYREEDDSILLPTDLYVDETTYLLEATQR